MSRFRYTIADLITTHCFVSVWFVDQYHEFLFLSVVVRCVA